MQTPVLTPALLGRHFCNITIFSDSSSSIKPHNDLSFPGSLEAMIDWRSPFNLETEFIQAVVDAQRKVMVEHHLL